MNKRWVLPIKLLLSASFLVACQNTGLPTSSDGLLQVPQAQTEQDALKTDVEMASLPSAADELGGEATVLGQAMVNLNDEEALLQHALDFSEQDNFNIQQAENTSSGRIAGVCLAKKPVLKRRDLGRFAALKDKFQYQAGFKTRLQALLPEVGDEVLASQRLDLNLVQGQLPQRLADYAQAQLDARKATLKDWLESNPLSLSSAIEQSKLEQRGLGHFTGRKSEVKSFTRPDGSVIRARLIELENTQTGVKHLLKVARHFQEVSGLNAEASAEASAKASYHLTNVLVTSYSLKADREQSMTRFIHFNDDGTGTAYTESYISWRDFTPDIIEDAIDSLNGVFGKKFQTQSEGAGTVQAHQRTLSFFLLTDGIESFKANIGTVTLDFTSPQGKQAQAVYNLTHGVSDAGQMFHYVRGQNQDVEVLLEADSSGALTVSSAQGEQESVQMFDVPAEGGAGCLSAND